MATAQRIAKPPPRASDAAHDARERSRLASLETQAGRAIYRCLCRATRTAAWVAWNGRDCPECNGRLERT